MSTLFLIYFLLAMILIAFLAGIYLGARRELDGFIKELKEQRNGNSEDRTARRT